MPRKILEKPKYEVVSHPERMNEIDSVFGRSEIPPDSHLWQQYFRKHPELEEQARKWLTMPGFGNVGPKIDVLMEDAILGPLITLGKEKQVDGQPAANRMVISPERATEKIKGFACHLGADVVGIGPLNPAWTYSHVGRVRFSGNVIGTPINLPHQHAIVVAKPLNRNMIGCAPQLPEIAEIIKQYLSLANIVVTLARYLRLLGYSARAHDIWNYQALMVPMAVDAGLGELSRNGILITEKYGSAVKMAAVTTDIPLINDKPVDIGVEEFCQSCRVCAEHCPVGAIPRGGKKVVRGIRKWQINDVACLEYMQHVGTDCAVCLDVCPWNRPRTWPHNWILWAVERSVTARRIAIKADTLLNHGRKGKTPYWMEPQQSEVWREKLRANHPYNRKS